MEMCKSKVALSMAKAIDQQVFRSRYVRTPPTAHATEIWGNQSAVRVPFVPQQ